jgi:hypothetical protein
MLSGKKLFGFSKDPNWKEFGLRIKEPRKKNGQPKIRRRSSS